MDQSKDRGLKVAILVFLIIFGFIIGFFLQSVRPTIVWQRNYLSPPQAVEHIMSFLKNDLLGQEVEIKLISLEDHYNLYRLKLEINGQHFLSYATKDGKLLFVDVIDMISPAERPLAQSDRPEVELFITPMDLSAYMATRALKESLGVFGDQVKVDLRYIIYSDQGEGLCWDAEQKYCSRSGVFGIEQTIRELCLVEHQPDKLWGFSQAIGAMLSFDDLEGSRALAQDNWPEKALELGIDLNQLESCFNDQAGNLLESQIGLVQQKRPVRHPARYVDSFGEYQDESVIARDGLVLVVNGMIYDQGEHIAFWEPQDYQQIICRSFKETSRPGACSEIMGEEELKDQDSLDDLSEIIDPEKELNDDLLID